ncbi:anti-sigma factor domain-containing protein [Metabacillus malikii]|uniref:RsgI N-terminal anti-sigma domain-containing protein n=1 Tax=Metabacillus malikii TaxID=1504265 RepID=A0ABT9ZD06_9BACI|nr:anti-sigma factor domain-containing protein [Metabacillus malikii]MDQ0229458.1 hypothetical protein [Metabacillus malikii]
MKKGVVVECNDDFVTLLTPDGQFLKTQNKQGQYELGEEISFLPYLEESEEAATTYPDTRLGKFFNIRKRKSNIRFGILSIAVIVFIFTLLPFFQEQKIYAYMSIDINPSFEVGIDSELRVISLDPLNNEAEQLVEKLPEWEEKHFQFIIDAIVKQSKKNGYVEPEKEILITTVMNEEDENVEKKLEANIDEIQDSYKAEKLNVQAIEADRKTREKAQKQGISMGKYIKLKEKEPLKEDTSIKKQFNHNGNEPEKDTKQQSHSANYISPTEPTDKNDMNKKEMDATETKRKLNEAKNKAKQNAMAQQHKMNKQDKHQQKQQQKQKKEQEKQREKQNKREKRENQVSNNKTVNKAYQKDKPNDVEHNKGKPDRNSNKN